MIITILFCILILMLALLETPLFILIGGLSVICLYFVEHDLPALQIIIIEMNRMASMPVLMALPLFVLVGCILTETKAPVRIMNFIQALLGWLPGGLAIAGLFACTFFTALTGASGVTIIAIGALLYPILKENEYDDKFSLGLLTTSGSLGLLFPPSLPVILYGVVAQVEIARIFKAALIPGLMLIFVLSGYAFVYELKKNRNRSNIIRQGFALNAVSLRKIGVAFWAAFWEWPIMLIIIIGIYGGYVTIAEVSALILIYVIIYECFILKEINLFKQLPEIIMESAMLSGAIMIILGFALGFTGYLVDQQMPDQILKYLTGITENKLIFLAGLNIILLAVGCIMDIFSAIIIIVPIIMPIALEYGVDPVHLCIIFLVNLEIGYSTPPVGINLFISSLKFKKPITLVYSASIPYLLLLLLCLGLITYIPSLSLFLLK